MALPGTRSYEREMAGLNTTMGSRNRMQSTTASSYGMSNGYGSSNNANAFQSKPRSAGASSFMSDQSGRRLDAIEQRVNGHDQQNRSILEQLMKFQQDVKMDMKKMEHGLAEERQQRMRMSNALQSTTSKLNELEDRVRVAETSARDNKNALAQLILHTKNVERAVNSSQQEIVAKKEQQAQKLQELHHKISSISSSNSNLERVTSNLKGDLGDLVEKVDSVNLEVKDLQGVIRVQGSMMEKKRGSSSVSKGSARNGKMSETQRAALEAKIMQLQEELLDVQSKLNHEIKDREQDESILNQRLADISAELKEVKNRRAADLKELEKSTKELAKMSSSEKQNIVMQISAVQTDLKHALDSRDTKGQDKIMTKLHELDQNLKAEVKARQESEKESKISAEAQHSQLKVYVDETADTMRKMMTNENETLRNRLIEVNDSINSIEIDLASLRSDLESGASIVSTDKEGREKILEAKIEDLSDRLRLGMNKLQAAVGESRMSKGQNGHSVSMEEAEVMYAEELEGIREKMAIQVSKLNEEINDLRIAMKKQEDLIKNELKMHQQAGEDASTILGDKLQQKMDAVTFTQERMKRQLDDLQDKVQAAPTDIVDMRDRLEDIEREFSRQSQAKKESGNSARNGDGEDGENELANMRKDLDAIMGKRDQDTSIVTGVPSLFHLAKEVEEAQAGVKKCSEDIETLKTEVDEKLEKEKEERVRESEEVKKELSRQEKRAAQLKEKYKNLKKASGQEGPELDDEEDNE